MSEEEEANSTEGEEIEEGGEGDEEVEGEGEEEKEDEAAEMQRPLAILLFELELAIFGKLLEEMQGNDGRSIDYDNDDDEEKTRRLQRRRPSDSSSASGSPLVWVSPDPLFASTLRRSRRSNLRAASDDGAAINGVDLVNGFESAATSVGAEEVALTVDGVATTAPLNAVFHAAKLDAEKILLSLYRK